MKKIILISIILIFLTGCGGSYNLNGFILPNDSGFLTLIKELDTPEKICQYMLDNFENEKHAYIILNPYQLYLIRKGDCNDFSTFATFIAHYHNIETYQIIMYYPKPVYPISAWHAIAVYKEWNCYTFSENQWYNPLKGCYNSFKNIMQIFNGWTKYIVYDYNMNIVETGYNN